MTDSEAVLRSVEEGVKKAQKYVGIKCMAPCESIKNRSIVIQQDAMLLLFFLNSETRVKSLVLENTALVSIPHNACLTRNILAMHMT